MCQYREKDGDIGERGTAKLTCGKQIFFEVYEEELGSGTDSEDFAEIEFA